MEGVLTGGGVSGRGTTTKTTGYRFRAPEIGMHISVI